MIRSAENGDELIVAVVTLANASALAVISTATQASGACWTCVSSHMKNSKISPAGQPLECFS